MTYLISSKVSSVDVSAKSLTTAAGETLTWQAALVIATGAEVSQAVTRTTAVMMHPCIQPLHSIAPIRQQPPVIQRPHIFKLEPSQYSPHCTHNPCERAAGAAVAAAQPKPAHLVAATRCRRLVCQTLAPLVLTWLVSSTCAMWLMLTACWQAWMQLRQPVER
jgi:hypothetical protein